jgi:hypothetical protein
MSDSLTRRALGGVRQRRWAEVERDRDAGDSDSEERQIKAHRMDDIDLGLVEELVAFVQDSVKSLMSELQAGRLSVAEFWVCLVTVMDRMHRTGIYRNTGNAGTPRGIALRLGRLTSNLWLVDGHSFAMVDGDSVAMCILPALDEYVLRGMIVTSVDRFSQLLAAVGPIIYKDMAMSESERMLEALGDLEWLVGSRLQMPHQNGVDTTHLLAFANVGDEARELVLTMLTTWVVDRMPEVLEADCLGKRWESTSRAEELRLVRKILAAASSRQAAALAAAALEKKGGGGQAKGGAPKFEGKCHHCQKQGHKRAECRKRIAEERAKKKKATAAK